MLRGARCLVVTALTLVVQAVPLFAAALPEITWRANKTVDAKIESCPLDKVLPRLAALSGWKVFVEPGLNEPVSVQFKNVPQGEALKLLFGSLNYALVPQKDGPSKLLVYRNSLSDATALVAPESSKPKNWLANEIILKVSADSKEDIEKLAKQLGGKIVAKSDELNAYRLQFDSAEQAQVAREKLGQKEGLDVQDNYAFDRPTNPVSSEGSLAGRLNIDPSPVTPGKQITVALIDTPIQPLGGKLDQFVLPSVHVGEGPSSLPTDPTHATAMLQDLLTGASFSERVFPADMKVSQEALGNIRILPIDIYGDSPTTDTFAVALGLLKAIQANVNVINMSFGGEGDNPMVEDLIRVAAQKQIKLVASAGNSPTDTPTLPAAIPYVTAVTAATSNGEIAPYANYGSFVDLKAPGSIRIYYNGQAYISTGTSTSAAFVSGQAAAAFANGLNLSQTSDLLNKIWNVNLTPVIKSGR